MARRCDVRATDGATTRDVVVRATRDVVVRATRDRRRAGVDDWRRCDARRKEQPINKNNILSEHGQYYLTIFVKKANKIRARWQRLVWRGHRVHMCCHILASRAPGHIFP
jgi:hypothetical protein